MTSQELVGLNVKWYRYQMGKSQEKFVSDKNITLSYLSRIECGTVNLTCISIDYLAKILNIQPKDLFNEETAMKAKKLPLKISNYNHVAQ